MVAAGSFVGVRFSVAVALLVLLSASALHALPLADSDAKFKSLQECLHRCVTRASNIQALNVCISRHVRELRSENENLRLSSSTEFAPLLAKKSSGQNAVEESQLNFPKSNMFRAAMSLQKLRGGTAEKEVPTAASENDTISYDYDYFVIGGGSGGVRSARIAATHGARVALAEAAAGGDSADG